MENGFKIIRRITVPPVFAAALLLIVYMTHTDYIGGIGHLLGGLFLLVVLPTLAYPLQKYIPKYKDRGREGQRSLAMLFSFAGYLLGTTAAFVFSAPVELKLIYIEYLLCGIGMLVLNRVFHIKASGHACGSVGPVIMLVYFGLYLPAIIGAMLVLPVYVSSIRTGQHTMPQLFGGSTIPAFMLFLTVTTGLLFG